MSKTRLNILQTTTIQHTNGTSGLVINSGGIPTRPNIPAFYAYTNTANFDSAVEIFTTKLNTTLVNNGSCYNTSNGRFTAPIAGIYQFQIKILARYNTSIGYIEPTLYKNGANVVSRSFGFAYVNTASDHDCITALAYISLATNDYVQMGVNVVTAGMTYYFGENLTSFCGHLIG